MTIVLRCQRALRECLDAPGVRELQQGRLVVAFSGGLDSSVLLHAARAVASRRLAAVHVNHGHSELADQWQAHCESVCRSMDVPLISRKLHLESAGASPGEAQFRAGRYGVFREVVGEGDVLLLAHHADDQAESVLLHVLQGRGAYGMPRQRAISGGCLLRPLLGLRRAELEAYARQVNLTWVEDTSNLDASFDRNLLRIDVLPRLETRFPNLTERLIRVAVQTAELQALATRGIDLDRSTLPVSVLSEAEPAVSAQLLRAWLARKGDSGVGAVSAAALTEFTRQLDCPGERQPRLDLPQGSLRRHRGEIFFVPRRAGTGGTSGNLPPVARDLPSPAGATPTVEVLEHGVLTVREDKHGTPLQGQLRLVYRQPGARLLVNGHHRSVKQLLREAAVPPWERSTYPLLADDAGLLSIPGIASRDVAQGDAEGDAKGDAERQEGCRLSARWVPTRLAIDGDR